MVSILSLCLLLGLLLVGATAVNLDRFATYDENQLMPITVQECRWNSHGQRDCDTMQVSKSLDSNWRWTHKAGV